MSVSRSSRSRSRSRSPVRRDLQEPYEIGSSAEEEPEEQPPDDDCRRFHIDKYPKTWTYKDIKQFIKDRTTSSIISSNIRYVNCNKSGHGYPTSTIEFLHSNVCRQAFKQLKSKENEKIDGRRILIRYTRESRTPQKASTVRQAMMKPTQPLISHDTYGLSKEFLDHLKIKVPISNKIFVANVDKQVDEAKLREVFGIAGQVVDVFIINNNDYKPKMVKIEYDHPLEAVQAISMFHNQVFYERLLAVQMDNVPNLHNKPLPDGLSSIGPGLGPNGTPMRSIRYTAEIQPLKELVNTELRKILTLINPEQNNGSQDNSAMSMMNQAMNLPQMTPLNINTMNAYNQPVMPVPNPFTPQTNAQGMQSLHVLQGLLQQNAGNDSAAALATLQAQSLAQNIIGYGQSFGTGQNDLYTRSLLNIGMQQSQMSNTQSDNGGSSKDKVNSFFDSNRKSYDNIQSNSFDIQSRASVDKEKDMVTTDMLIFNNLPSSVTLPILKGKMCEVGEIKFAEITDEGKAIVRFCRTQDAERCVKLFDRSKVDGQLIQVRFF